MLLKHSVGDDGSHSTFGLLGLNHGMLNILPAAERALLTLV